MKKEPNMQNISLDTLFELSEFFKFFGDTTRIRVIHLLLSGEMSVSAIAEKLNLEQSVVSHQLRILKSGDLVQGRRDGKRIIYSLADDHVHTIIAQGTEHVEEEL